MHNEIVMLFSDIKCFCKYSLQQVHNKLVVDTNVSSNAAVAFLGTTVTSNDDTLALQSSAAGSAQNVGIQILDRTGEVLILDGATFSAKTDLIDGTNILPFQ